MTVFADVRRWQVCRKLAGGDRPVVAAKAIGDDAGVSKAGDWRECDRQMTTVALVARQWMINRFSRRRLVVVAADAVADRFTVIHALQRKETARGVTGFALLRRQHVARRFRRGDNGAACIVAIGTTPERTSEYAAAMAVATAGDHVRAFQAEPRGIVIEVRVNGGLRRD